MSKLNGRLACITTIAAFCAVIPISRSADPVSTKAQWQTTVNKAIGYLKTTQEDNGGWSTKTSIGVTGVVTTGLLQCGVTPDDAPASKGLEFIEKLINTKAGHIAGADPKMGLQNYVTSINVMALATAKRDAKFKPVIKNGTEFL